MSVFVEWAAQAANFLRGALAFNSGTGGAGPPPLAGPWYVDATLGSDPNDGNSALLPWKTVAKVLTDTFPGDTVNWKRGEVWREYALNPPTAQTWQAYGAGTALWKISGMDIVTGTWTLVGGTVWSIPYTTILPSVTGVDVDGFHYPIAATLAAIVLGQCFYNAATDILYLDITGGDSTMSGRVVEANGQRQSCLAATGGHGSYTMTNGYFHGGTDGTVIMQNNNAASSWTSCRFGHGGAINSIGLLFMQEGNNSGITITNCLFENGNSDSLFINDNPFFIVSYCTFIGLYGPVSDHIECGGLNGTNGGSEVHHCYFFVQPDTTSPKGCVAMVANQAFPGFSFHDNFMDGGNYGISISTSVATGHTGYQILRNIAVNTLLNSSVGSFGNAGPSDQCVWAYNVSLNSAYDAMNFYGGTDHNRIGVYQNTFYAFGFRGITCGAPADKLSGTIEDNIIYSAASTSNQIRYNDGVAAQLLVSDYNDIGPEKASGYSYNGTAYNTLALYQAGATQDAHSIKSAPIFTAGTQTARYGSTLSFGDPTWSSIAPTALSPVVGAGVHVAGINDPPFANPPDLGAFQLGAGGQGTPPSTGDSSKPCGTGILGRIWSGMW